MAWSYRQDRMDEIYHNKVGVGMVDAIAVPETPADFQDALNMGGGMDPQAAKALSGEPTKKEKVKEGEETVTQFQEYPGQNVPRVIEGEGETKKDKEIVKAAKAQPKEDEPTLAEIEARDKERTRITAEETARIQSEERAKEEEKLRKEVQADLKKSEAAEKKNEKAELASAKK